MKITWKAVAFYTAILVVVFIIVFFLLQSHLSNKWTTKYDELDGKFKVKNEEFINFREEAEKEKVKLREERDKEKEKRKELDTRVTRLNAEKIKLKNDLEREKEKTSALSGDELTNKLNERVPTEFTLLQAGDFNLTRLGAENTLNLFLEGEFHLDNYNKQMKITEENIKIIGSLNKDMLSLKKEIVLSDEELKKCNEARESSIEAKKALEKAFKSKKWKARGVGFLGGSLATILIFKILKII